jgi:hypothetical protein
MIERFSLTGPGLCPTIPKDAGLLVAAEENKYGK